MFRSLMGGVLALLMTVALGGCAVAAGAGAAGGAYEYQNKRQLEKLDQRLESGDISEEEYIEQKKQIEEGSVIY